MLRPDALHIEGLGKLIQAAVEVGAKLHEIFDVIYDWKIDLQAIKAAVSNTVRELGRASNPAALVSLVWSVPTQTGFSPLWSSAAPFGHRPQAALDHGALLCRPLNPIQSR